MVRIFKYALAIALTTYAIGANAQGSSRSNTPERFYQPAVSNYYLSIDYRTYMSKPTYAVKQNGVKLWDTTTDTTANGIKIGYGVLDNLAMGIETTMGQSQTTTIDTSGTQTNTRSSGMSDLVGGLTGIVPFSGWNMHYELKAGISLVKKKDATSTQEGNEASGGTSIRPAIGFSYLMGSTSFIGFRADYISRLERTANNGSADYKITEGNQFTYTLFYEMGLGSFALDLALFLSEIEKTTNTYTGGSTTTTTPYTSSGGSLGAQYQITAALNFRLEYTMTMVPDITAAGLNRSAHSTSAILARLRIEL